jgi:nicotinate-nucleotide adenylyltransferase
MSTSATAIFGGTFDPVHCAHIMVAREAADEFSIKRVLFIPAGQPPHKSDTTSASWEDRFHMVELACRADPRFIPSRLEEGDSPSYSILTIEKVRRETDDLWFIIGADAFAEIATWHRWREVIAETGFIVVTRPGHQWEAPPGARVRRLDTLALPVSSSDIRARLAAGEIPPELSPEVADYIRARGLYNWPATASPPASP